MNANNVGMLIGEIWGEKVKRMVKSDYSIEYLNLKRRSTVGLHRNDDGIHKFTDDKIEDIRLLCAERPSWRIDTSLVSKNTIVLMHPFEVARRETIAVDGHCLSMEIKIVLGKTPTIKISTFGQEVSFSEIIGMDIQEISLRTIDEATCAAESASLCIGTTVCSDDESSLSKIGSIRFESCYCQNAKSGMPEKITFKVVLAIPITYKLVQKLLLCCKALSQQVDQEKTQFIMQRSSAQKLQHAISS